MQTDFQSDSSNIYQFSSLQVRWSTTRTCNRICYWLQARGTKSNPSTSFYSPLSISNIYLVSHAFVCRVRAHLYRISLIIIQIVQSVLRISREDRWISFRSMADTIMNIYNPELFQKLCSTTFSFPIVATIKINLFKQKYSFTRRKSSIYMNLCDRNWKICTLRIFNIIKKYDIMFLNCNSFLLFE